MEVKIGIVLIVLLMGLNIYAWGWHYTPTVDTNKVWCEKNGGRWINSYRNQHCEWVPEYLKNK